jgi:hypothetical protein
LIPWPNNALTTTIVENMALEISTQATKAALQFSVVGAIISAIAL